jgi:hypothetical protein
MAHLPERLRFGICWQADPRAPVVLDEFRRDPRFRFFDTTIEESQGGPWARNIAQSLWRGEAYTLQVDSHMKFEPEWDARSIEMLEGMPSEKPILTMNAPLFWYDDEGALHRKFEMGVPTTRVSEWTASSHWAPWFDFGPPNDKNPGRTRFINGNFAFARGAWNVEVPQDPCQYYWGEELNVTIRSFTWGYDFFLPTEVVAWHMNHIDGPPRRHWEQGEAAVQRRNAEAYARLDRLLSSRDAPLPGPYGFGRARTLHDYELFSGLDFAAKRAHPDVFTGANPDPVTIQSPADWERCLTIEEFHAAIEGGERAERGLDASR